MGCGCGGEGQCGGEGGGEGEGGEGDQPGIEPGISATA